MRRSRRRLTRDLLNWSTRARFNARLVEREGVVVLTARNESGSVGYAIFDKPLSHLHYMETREDCRRRGVASRLWARVREEAVHPEITASADTEDRKRRVAAWGFGEADGIWNWRESRCVPRGYGAAATSTPVTG